jgi:SAM-dependent methyltransferase
LRGCTGSKLVVLSAECACATAGHGRYTLRLSESELARYRMMARSALEHEADDWRAAGIRPGARVADVGCGPAVILIELARLVGPHGAAVGVERDAAARAVASELLAAEGLEQAVVIDGDADATGLDPASFDTVMVAKCSCTTVAARRQ